MTLLQTIIYEPTEFDPPHTEANVRWTLELADGWRINVVRFRSGYVSSGMSYRAGRKGSGKKHSARRDAAERAWRQLAETWA